MPCDTVQTNSLEISKMHPALLLAALKQLGAVAIVQGVNVTRFVLDGQGVTIRGGMMTVNEGSEGIADRVKVAYSRQSVLTAARQHGWKIKETRANVFQVVK